jgi:nucleotide-binding universal stress UspA family protein
MKVLLCVDDDPQYEALMDAVEWTLAVGADDEVLVTHVVATLRWLPFTANDSGWAGTERDILDKVDEFLRRTVERLARTGIRAKPLRLEGDVAAELAEAAESHDIDVIVAGAIGQARSQDFLVGSVAEKLVSASKCALLLARRGKVSSRGELRVTVAVDDTDTSYRAIQSFADALHADRASVEIVHVMQIPPPREDAVREGTARKPPVPPVVQERADHAVSRAQEVFASRGIQPRLALRRGDPAREILGAARAFDASVIVLGRRETNTGTRLDGWRGTITERVAQHAPCSVFIGAAIPKSSQRGTEPKRQ